MQALEGTAIIDLESLRPEESYSACMSDAELAYLGAPRMQAQRQQSLGARLCLKHLFLQQMACNISDRFIPIHSDDLNRFPAWLYREVSASQNPKTAAPALKWCGTRLPNLSVSLSHSGTLCCASLASARGIGVDVESATARTPEFYRAYFSAEERGWVAANSVAIDAAWLFTILWSLKECAFKAARGEEWAFTDLAAIEVVGFPELADVNAAYESSQLMLEPSRFQVAMSSHQRIDWFDCELGGNRDHVVVVARRSTTRGRIRHHDT